MRKIKATQARVRELFDYDSRTGFLRYKTKVRNMYPRTVGDFAGNKFKNGYYYIKFDGERHLLHRIVWLWWYGYNSENVIDHIDGDPANNRITNLREVSESCNLRNSKVRLDSSSGVKGVSRSILESGEVVWSVRITVNGVRIWLGRVEDLVEAAALRLAAEQCVGWHSCDAQSSTLKFLKGRLGL